MLGGFSRSRCLAAARGHLSVEVMLGLGFSRFFSLSLRNRFLEQGLGDKYAQEYLNTPLDESNAFFRRSDFLSMADGDHDSAKVYYVGCDLAVTTKTENDYTVFVVGGVDEKGILHIVDVRRERIDSVEIVDLILNLNRRYDPQLFFFEKGAITNSILPHLVNKMVAENNFVTYELFARTVDKKQYAHTIQARMRSKQVKFDKKADWYQTFESEMHRFPRDRKDDQVDAMAILGHGLKRFIEAPTVKELVDEAYQEEMALFDMYEGKSEITGY